MGENSSDQIANFFLKTIKAISWTFGLLFLGAGFIGLGSMVIAQKPENFGDTAISILVGLFLTPITRRFILKTVGKPSDKEAEQPILSTVEAPNITNAKLTSCKACGGAVAKTSWKCPHCGQGNPGTPNWAYAVTALLLIGLPASCIVSVINTEPRVIDVNTDLSRAGYRHCTFFVKQTLKSPVTAKFPDIDTRFWKPEGQQVYMFKSTLDAQNAFGVPLRNNWRCKIEFIGKSEYDIHDWKLLEISVDKP